MRQATAAIRRPVSVSIRRAQRGTRRARTLGHYSLLPLLGLVFALPLVWMLSTSLKNAVQTYLVLPIVALFFFAQRAFVEGVAISSLRG